MGKHYLRQLIRNYLNGKATNEEKRQLDAWWDYNLHDDRFLQSLPKEQQEQLFDDMLATIWQRIEQPHTEGTVVRPMPQSRRFVWPLFRVAAAVVLVGLGAWLAFRYIATRPTVETAYGQRREVRLPDGSQVVLNGNSSIRYGTWNTTDAREVWLEGEAFFAVTHTRNHQRFVVHTPDQLAVEVLGTRFNVNSRHARTKVVLEEGKVRITDGQKQSVTLRPGMGLSYARNRPVPTLRPTPVNLARQLSWKDNLLLFDDEPLLNVFAQLHDSHGLNVEIRTSALTDQSFTGSVPADDIGELFRKVEKIYGVRVRQEGDRYIID